MKTQENSAAPERFRRLSATLVLLALGLPVAAALAQGSATPPDDDALLRQAQSAAQAGQLPKAESIVETLRSRHPASYELSEFLGILYASDGKLALALPALQTAVNENPGAAAARANLGMAYLKSGDAAKAKENLERADHLESGNPRTEAALGQAWLLLKQPAPAAQAFTAALRDAGPDGTLGPDLLYDAALAFFEAGDAVRAAPLLERMPGAANSAAAQSLLADVDEHLGRYADANVHYAAAGRLDPSEANLYLLGVDLLRHWTFAPAEQAFAQGVARYPQSERMQFALGVASYVNLDYAQAIHVFTALLGAKNSREADARMLGRACSAEAAGEHPGCAALITYAVGHPADAQVNIYAATTLLHGATSDAGLVSAGELLTHAIAADPNLAEAHYERGLLLQRQAKWGESIPELQQAIRLRAAYASAHYRLALAYAHTGRHAAAQTEIALQQKYSEAEKQQLASELKQVATAAVKAP